MGESARKGSETMTDEQLLRRLKAQQPDALEELMGKYRRVVYITAAGVLGKAGTPPDVEEIAQDTFLAVWHHAAVIQPGKLRAYLAATARNKAKSFLRTRRELPMDLDTVDLPDDGCSLDEALARKETARAVRKAIHKMRPKDREIFLRYYYYLQTTDQIAETMGIPPSTVRSRLSRGRKTLKETLSKEVLY